MNLRNAFIFFGPPGAGKGTVSRRCVEQLGWIQLSTGDLFRKHIQERTSLGKAIEEAISQGKLVDDTTVIELVYDWIMYHKNNHKPLILDGFPRTLKQAELFLDKISNYGMKCTVIVLDIPDQVVIDRLSMRRICQNYNCQKIYSIKNISIHICEICGSGLYQRADDSADTVKNRLTVYHQHANTLLEFYKNHGIEIKKVNADQSIDQVFHEVLLVAGETK
jgi:adenylate kinase